MCSARLSISWIVLVLQALFKGFVNWLFILTREFYILYYIVYCKGLGLLSMANTLDFWVKGFFGAMYCCNGKTVFIYIFSFRRNFFIHGINFPPVLSHKFTTMSVYRLLHTYLSLCKKGGLELASLFTKTLHWMSPKGFLKLLMDVIFVNSIK